MRRKAHVRFGERDGRDRWVKSRYGAPVPSLRDPEPSGADVVFTKRLAEACDLVGVMLVDHLILGGVGVWCSMRWEGYFSED